MPVDTGEENAVSIKFEVRDDLPEQSEEEIALLHGCQCSDVDVTEERYLLTLTEGSPSVIHERCGHHLGGFEPDEYEAEGIPVKVTPHVEYAYPGEVDVLWLEIEHDVR